MGQKRTLLNKLTTSTRKPSDKKGTKNRRVIFGTAADNGTEALIYQFHTTKGRMRFRFVPSEMVPQDWAKAMHELSGLPIQASDVEAAADTIDTDKLVSIAIDDPRHDAPVIYTGEGSGLGGAGQ